jgi:predicted DNA-binding mobile mystery protein A
MANLRQLRRNQLDNALSQWRQARLPARPATGWVKAIRQALGMSSLALARRLAVTDSAVRKFEQAERKDAITLGTLRKVAAALDCELQYALVPRQPLNDTLQAQAGLRAKQQVLTVSKSMALEDQAVDPAFAAAQIEAVTQALLAKSGKGLW